MTEEKFVLDVTRIISILKKNVILLAAVTVVFLGIGYYVASAQQVSKETVYSIEVKKSQLEPQGEALLEELQLALHPKVNMLPNILNPKAFTDDLRQLFNSGEWKKVIDNQLALKVKFQNGTVTIAVVSPVTLLESDIEADLQAFVSHINKKLIKKASLVLTNERFNKKVELNQLIATSEIQRDREISKINLGLLPYSNLKDDMRAELIDTYMSISDMSFFVPRVRLVEDSIQVLDEVTIDESILGVTTKMTKLQERVLGLSNHVIALMMALLGFALSLSVLIGLNTLKRVRQ